MSEEQKEKKKPVRVWVDGCFDLFHFGHANAIRQAKLMGDVLVAGIHSDAEIEIHKGPPVYNEEERRRMVSSIKWVDEVVVGVPYFTALSILDENNCDFCVHGDDVTMTADGEDSYKEVKAVGRYKECQRTRGISTTDLVGRMILATKQHHQTNYTGNAKELEIAGQSPSSHTPYTRTSKYIATTKRIVEFSSGKEPKPTDRIVYCAGAFDLFHVGHLDFLEKVAKEGDYIIVGIHSDKVVNRYKGSNLPIMTTHERVLSVLANKYVSEVVIGAPYSVTSEMMEHFRIDVVIHGSTVIHADEDGTDPYEVPKKMGKFKIIESGNTLSSRDIMNRIIQNRLKYELRNKKKEEKEMNYSYFHSKQESAKK